MTNCDKCKYRRKCPFKYQWFCCEDFEREDNENG